MTSTPYEPALVEAQPAGERLWRWASDLCCAAVAVFVLYTIAFGRLPTDLQSAIVLTLTLTAVLCTSRPQAARSPLHAAEIAIRILLIGAAVASGLYYIANYQEIAALRSGLPNQWDLIAYGLGLIAIMEGSRRAEGLMFLCVVLVFVAYLAFGQHIPGMLGHRPFSLSELLELGYSPTGVYGTAFTSVVNVVYIFVVLGVALRITGAGDFFNFISEIFTRGMRSGPAQCAVVSSALFGSINGSAPANVAATGVLTIPLMKRAGYSASYAGAVEASSSCVGQIMPPVMGVGAFIMSEITGIPYGEIAIAAIVPSMLFIGSISVAVMLEARKLDLRPIGDSSEEGLVWDSTRKAQGVVLVGTFVVLLAMLFSGYSATYAGFGATMATVVLAMLFPQLRLSAQDFWRLLVDSGRDGMNLAVACAAMGIIIAGVSATGLGVKMNQAIMSVGDSSLILALLLAAACSLIVGLGLPTAASYLMVVFIAGPALIKLGITELQAHMFVFYYAVLSAITPPVALAVSTASALAGAPQMAVAVHTMRLSFVGFIVPIAWMYHPELMITDVDLTGVPRMAFGITAFAFAVFALSAAFIGIIRTPLAIWERLALFAGATLIVWPDDVLTVVGLVVLALVAARQFRRGPDPAAA